MRSRKTFLLGETVALFGGLGSLKKEREGGVTVDGRSKTENNLLEVKGGDASIFRAAVAFTRKPVTPSSLQGDLSEFWLEILRVVGPADGQPRQIRLYTTFGNQIRCSSLQSQVEAWG